jgi:hypothetical protein
MHEGTHCQLPREVECNACSTVHSCLPRVWAVAVQVSGTPTLQASCNDVFPMQRMSPMGLSVDYPLNLHDPGACQ